MKIESAADMDVESLTSLLLFLGADVKSNDALVQAMDIGVSVEPENIIEYNINLTISATNDAIFNKKIENFT